MTNKCKCGGTFCFSIELDQILNDSPWNKRQYDAYVCEKCGTMRNNTEEHQGFMPFFKLEMVHNPDRKWWQFWKPKMIQKLDEPQKIAVDIKKGN